VIKALETGWIPPTINFKTYDPECDLDYTINKAVKREIEYAMNVNIGFGGQNAAIIFKKVK
jgi:3-oxoacyl-[acyl-carrier-protein] synthase II